MNPKTYPAAGLKLARVLILAVGALCAGCNSLDNPLTSIPIFRSGHDGRVFNSRTGEYEWPKEAPARPANASRRAAPATATPAPKNNGRPYDPQKGEFADPSPGR